jgi:AAA family ATP:ADP antiporter
VTSRAHLVLLLTAATLVAQQVASNALRDGMFLSWFPVTTLPYFVATSAALAIPAAESSGRLLAHLGPYRLVPIVLGANTLLFVIEWALIGGQPRVATVLLYMHTSVLGAIGMSAFWSLLNERFDPHSAKRLMSRVAASAAFGGLSGGIGAERVAALLSQRALLLSLGFAGAACVAGAVAIGRGMPARPSRSPEPDHRSGWTEIRREPLLRDLAVVVALAAALAALVDYVLKAEAVATFGRGEPLVRFFGLFYAGTGVAAFVLQATLGRLVLARLGLGGSVSSHPIVVGAAGVLGFILPAPWRGIFPRGFDVALRASIFRTGYELFYTPLPDVTKRTAKSVIDVTADCLGKGAGAAVILILTRISPVYSVAAVHLAGVVVAGAELVVARRLRAGYVSALEGGLRRQGEDLERAAQYSLSNFTIVESMAALDPASVLRALGQPAERSVHAWPPDPIVAAIVELRSGDPVRTRAALHALPPHPLVIGALIPLLEQRALLREVVAALTSFGSRGAGQLVDAMLSPATPDVVRRRLPLVLKSCASTLARDGLISGLSAIDFDLRLRCGRALLALIDRSPDLTVSPHVALDAVERALTDTGDSVFVREHVFNLLALALDRESVKIAAMAFETDDPYLRGTALEYLETVLPPTLFSTLTPRLAAAEAPSRRGRSAAVARADLLRAGETLKVSLEEVRRQLAASRQDEESEDAAIARTPRAQ